MASRVLAVDDNQINLKMISATLLHGGFEAYISESGADALSRVEQIKPDLIILDIDMPEMDGYQVCQTLRQRPTTRHIPIMMLTAHDTLEEKVRGFEVGADDYMTKPFQPAELQARIKGLLRRSALQVVPEKQNVDGKFISVFSLRGGVGVSTVATNLAAGLAQVWGKPVALVDMAFIMGQCALMLNLTLRNTWADLAKVNLNEIDSDLVQNVMMKHASGVSVLAAPRFSVDAELISPPVVEKVLGMLKKKFAYVVMDLPHDFSETTLMGIDQADELMLVLAPELASVRATVGSLETLNQLQFPAENVRLILNWVFEKRGLARKDIEKVVKHPLQLVVPFASETFVSSINLGIPPVINAPTSALGMLFEDMAYAFSREEDIDSIPTNPSPAWLRVNERSKQARKR
ncbi:MAG: response regulator [Anaerolineae bacterium]|nr:response regulator [Anaerolineae bacterium]